jgi:hypothetical protein
MDHPLLARG